MSIEDRNIDDIDEYEMIPFEPMMYGYEQMDMRPNIGMPMEYMQDVDPNMGMNPWMGMIQFNEGMPMNGFNPMGMYDDASMKDYEDEDEVSRQPDNYGDKELYKDGINNPNKFNPKYNNVDSIVRRIERYNPAIFRRLTRCGMPYAEARDIVRRIVRLTLMYSEE